MKIGIITFHASLNCGSMLQAFALQEVLEKKYSADVEMINFSNLGQRNYYALWDFFPRPKIIKQNLKAIKHYDAIKKVRADYHKFSKKYFNITTPLLKNKFQLKKIESNYDIIIAGGDQVWNVRCRDADPAYFLSFVKTAKKVAYSPSLGARNINKVALNPQKYANLLKDFDHLSVRENNGQMWLKELIGIDVPIIADPTMLLTKDEWVKCLDLKEIKEDFILFYAFYYNNHENNLILQEISKKYYMPIYIIDGKSWSVNKLDQYGIKVWKQSGPVGLLNLMMSAKISLVQSFHGIVFSTLFKKTFWSLRGDKIVNADDDRAKVILTQLDLNDRAIPYSQLLKTDLLKPVDYTQAEINTEKMRKTANDYIKEFLN